MDQPNPALRTPSTGRELRCYHCGESCYDDRISIQDKLFCCDGCRLVYELLAENDLCAYYDISKNPGISPAESGVGKKYAYMDSPQIVRQLIDFQNDDMTRVSFVLPSIHCSSCIWLLENLYRINDAFLSSEVNFLRREIVIRFDHRKISLRRVVETLVSLGYEPEINLASLEKKVHQRTDRDLYIKIGVAGFAFGNIMLLSFPEYLAGGESVDPFLRIVFGYLSILLAIPVLLYSSRDYFSSAWNGLRRGNINMDVPISLGIIALFVRSTIEILFAGGPGFLDSFTGLVFFLLIGKIFQQKTYHRLSFERDYRSYFPLSVIRREKDETNHIPLDRLAVNDRILIRNQEIIPADSVLIKGDGMIDYSFVTGESSPVLKASGDLVYAGGRQMGSTVELEVIKEVSHSYLTQLWNQDVHPGGHASRIISLSDKISKYFTIIVLSVALIAGFYWLQESIAMALNTFTAVLIIACPCALALSTPFTLGNTLRIFGHNRFYLKNAAVIEKLAHITRVILDKTGTITVGRLSDVRFTPLDPHQNLAEAHMEAVKSLVSHSTHPLSRLIYDHLQVRSNTKITEFREFPGSGIEGTVDGRIYRIGTQKFTGDHEAQKADSFLASHVHVSVDNTPLGYFRVYSRYRPSLEKTIARLQGRFKVDLISGDHATGIKYLRSVFGRESTLQFTRSPQDKRLFIGSLQEQGECTLMVGDGLNDAGALMQSDVGIVISENVNAFSPASDGILDADQFQRLPDFIRFARVSLHIIMVSFLISFLYNFIGLGIAVQGILSPLLAAILMPLSSVSVVAFTTGMTSLMAGRYGFSVRMKDRLQDKENRP